MKEELGVENTKVPPGSRPAEATALQKIREMAAALAPEATEQYKEQMRARQLADAEAMMPLPGQFSIEKWQLDVEEMKERMAKAQANAASEAIKRQVAGDHYVKMGLQPWDVIDESFTKTEAAAFYRGNCIKYLMRAGKKGEFKEDIQKAQHYLEKLLEILE